MCQRRMAGIGDLYVGLDAEVCIAIWQCTSAMKTLMRRTAQDTVDTAQKQIGVRAQLGHDFFSTWPCIGFE